jgi:hypothetical protein
MEQILRLESEERPENRQDRRLVCRRQNADLAELDRLFIRSCTRIMWPAEKSADERFSADEQKL